MDEWEISINSGTTNAHVTVFQNRSISIFSDNLGYFLLKNAQYPNLWPPCEGIWSKSSILSFMEKFSTQRLVFFRLWPISFELLMVITWNLVQELLLLFRWTNLSKVCFSCHGYLMTSFRSAATGKNNAELISHISWMKRAMLILFWFLK